MQWRFLWTVWFNVYHRSSEGWDHESDLLKAYCLLCPNSVRTVMYKMWASKESAQKTVSIFSPWVALCPAGADSVALSACFGCAVTGRGSGVAFILSPSNAERLAGCGPFVIRLSSFLQAAAGTLVSTGSAKLRQKDNDTNTLALSTLKSSSG